MLPEVLSNFACSLRPNEEKYTFSAVFEMNKNAQVLKYVDRADGNALRPAICLRRGTGNHRKSNSGVGIPYECRNLAYGLRI